MALVEVRWCLGFVCGTGGLASLRGAVKRCADSFLSCDSRGAGGHLPGWA